MFLIKFISMKLYKNLKLILTKKELSLMPRSFEVVGDILIFSRFPKQLKKREKIIGNKILSLLNNIKVVCIKDGKHFGKYRTNKIKIIAGDKRKTTLHKENNVLIKVDVEKCYFSPRLSTERLRISSLVKNEDVLVMFSGVGIYCLILAKNAKQVYGIEVNPTAHKYALENLKLNKINNVKLIKGDVRKVLPKLKFDRIIMPLPKDAYKFLDLALKAIKKNGIIHLYDFEDEKEIYKVVEKIQAKVKKFKVLNIVKCGQFGVRKYRICVDFKVL